MQSVSSRIWTRVTVSISYDDNHYTTGTYLSLYKCVCVCLCVCVCVCVCVFGLVWFYGISTIVGYLMPNPFLNI